jgi:hypothetical protein
MTPSSELLERFLEGSETPEEGEEFARRLRKDVDLGAALYDRVMLEVDLFETYAGIAQLHSALPRRRGWRGRGVPLAIAAAALFLVGLLVVLFGERPRSVPAPPTPTPVPANPAPAPAKVERSRTREHDEHDEHEHKLDEIEREYQKGLREVERKRHEGKDAEAEKTLREIERERDRKLREQDRRRKDD